MILRAAPGYELLRQVVRREEVNARLVKAGRENDGANLAINDDFFLHALIPGRP
jgi:hypothetical protein